MRLLPAFALSASLALGACQHPDGTTDWGGTLALGGGIAALTGVALLAANDGRDDRYHRRNHRRGGYDSHYGYRAPRPAYGYGAPYARAHYPRGW
ncbi:hypothetical protein GXW77_04950 [Roseomonas alkaliterrae]|uniref:Lipoprotein n=1 Tax=Neoroseomonas alkaliterrae TaxID=1452450 RepID=A0A840Y7G6_9PROT|nr:hypothetical protein [Neoroseomonas alkaliterrae]MBB5690003.1 hypothetical protein [Neoroseomonas alkaliterrae]MBR0675519.1 hypothetical protein [Neoroseomonas alkaliterrae]